LYGFGYYQDMPQLKIEHREASSGRVPTPSEGTALVFTRYRSEQAVVMHPSDFKRLTQLDEALEAYGAQTPISDLALRAHRGESTPGTPIEDPAEIKRRLGL
jgi:hypothetical protein